MQKAGQECPPRPTTSSIEIQDLRIKLIYEEWLELCDALGLKLDASFSYIRTGEEKADLVLIADAIGDLLYVVLGAAVAFGIDMEPIFNEIQRSNMSKFIDGHRREDGKWIKGPSYSPANLEPIIEQQKIG
jgi:predicted HAD superfamily Cof-like phosphohydrolase